MVMQDSNLRQHHLLLCIEIMASPLQLVSGVSVEQLGVVVLHLSSKCILAMYAV